MHKKILCLILTSAVLISGCGRTAPETTPPTEESPARAEDPAEADASEATSDEGTETEASETDAPDASGTTAGEDPADPEAEGYTFNPHLYVSLFDADIPQDYWDSFHDLCDALRAGETTFACSSEEAYKWAMDPATLNTLFPAACMKVTSKSDDGAVPYENGVGRIYYQMPADEFVEREAAFEAMVEDILGTWLEPDDDEFEKAIKLYDYMESTYDYRHDFLEEMPDGACYYSMANGTGQCVDLANIYAYLLLQAGVEAVEIGSNTPEMAHEWTYFVINGEGYNSDPTWSLKSEIGSDELALDYFLMSDDRREGSGCPLDDLTSPLLPKYWFKYSASQISATDEILVFPYGSYFVSMDEENKIAHYYTYEGDEELYYGQS